MPHTVRQLAFLDLQFRAFKLIQLPHGVRQLNQLVLARLGRLGRFVRLVISS